jgi:hypothetical protein
MMEAVTNSETSVNFYEATWCYIPQDCRLNRRRKNPKSNNIQRTKEEKFNGKIKGENKKGI